MSDKVDLDDQDEVVVIEERDNKTLYYIAIAAVLGIAMGGLIGASITSSRWQSAYEVLEAHGKQIEEAAAKITVQQVVQAEQKAVDVGAEIEKGVTEKLELIATDYQQEIESAKAALSSLTEENLSLKAELAAQTATLESTQKELTTLDRQAQLQANVLERSRELFQRELIIKQELSALEEQRETLQPKVQRYKKECDIYLDGKSWDVAKDACDKHDEANSRLSQVDQMIEVHKLDLNDIQQISEQIGL